MAQKLIKIGSSVGVTLTKKDREIAMIGMEDEIETISSPFEIKIIKKIKKSESTVVDKELLGWTDKFINEYRPALEELADK
ncbi:MAG TPA: hypothetical protein VJH55_01855 [Candidatus Paceibacterota bacterium]